MILPNLAVKDVDASVAFYTQKLGFKHDFTAPGPDGKSAFAFVMLDEGTALMVGANPDLKPGDRCGLGVDLMIYLPEGMDIDQVYASARSKGVPILEEIGDRYWGDRTFAVSDPDGYRITLAHTFKQMSFDEAMESLRQQQGGQ